MSIVHKLSRAVLLLLTLLLVAKAFAAIDVYEFDNDQQRERYTRLTDVLRCPKCQNQNLAGSNSPISADLRREIHRMVVEGKTDQEIVDFMVDRYGEFILYEPRVESSTYVLWYGPLLLLLVGLVIAYMLSRRKPAQVSSIDAVQQARLNSLLNSDKSDKQDKK